MKVEVIKEEKNELEIKIDNLTIAEVLRVYLNNKGIDFAAWKREHPFRPIIFRVQSEGKTVRKAISESVSDIKGDLSKIVSLVKKK